MEHPACDLRDLREAESNLLDHHAWVNKNAGIVRIPIVRTIDLIAASADLVRTDK
jgi:hypothetical protein